MAEEIHKEKFVQTGRWKALILKELLTNPEYIVGEVQLSGKTLTITWARRERIKV